jgi:hypothetical protein
MVGAMTDRLVNITPLRKCRLWSGSIEQWEFLNGGGLYASSVQHKIEQLERCDDRTEGEEEYLAALRIALNPTPITTAMLPPAKGFKP